MRGTPPRGSAEIWETRVSEPTARVGIVMGSDSDWPVMKEAATALGSSTSPSRRTSSRRTGCPSEMLAYGKEAAGRGLQVIIAGAGAPPTCPACSPGHAAARDRRTGAVEEPRRPGLPAVDRADARRRPGGDGRGRNARNAGLLAVRILAASDPGLQQKMLDFQAELQEVRRGQGQGRARSGRAGPRRIGF